MEQPFFYFKPLKTWEMVITALYAVLTLWIALNIKDWPAASRQDTLLLYFIITQLVVIMVFYASLRNLTFYLIWFFFASIHLMFYAKSDHVASVANGNISSGLKITVILLIIFQVLRFISLKWQHQEFVMPSKSEKDIMEERKVSIIDKVIFAVYMGAWMGLMFLFTL